MAYDAIWLEKFRWRTIRNQRDKLSGHVELDEFFTGASRSGKRGQEATSKTIVAVSMKQWLIEKRMGRIRSHVVLDCSAYLLETFILDDIEPGAAIVTDS